jgi:hypothetical protein
MNDGTIEQDELLKKAERRADAVIAFRQHLTVYIVINALIFVIWLVIALVAGGDAWFPWFVFPLVGWGIGITMHGWNVYGQSEAKREKLIAKELEHMKAKKQAK